jgi:tRNA(Arg) A34 adenosine deaminase TadA
MIPASYKPRKKFMELAIAEARRAGARGDYPIGAVITRLTGNREVVIASAGNRVKTSGSSIKHVELELSNMFPAATDAIFRTSFFIPPTSLAPCARAPA